MSEDVSAAELASGARSLEALREAAAGCRACELWRKGTQTVFGEGGRSAELMLVGEQPGDREDVAGRPFVGPAGRLLDEVLEEVGIDRRLLGREFRVTRSRGEVLASTGLAPYVMATIHPSAVVRAPDAESRRAEQRALADDLRNVAALLPTRV